MATLADTGNLYTANGPADFWHVISEPKPSDAEWAAAAEAAINALGLPELRSATDMGRLLAQTLGESQFGVNHWDLGPSKRLYYELKPFLPRAVTRLLRQVHGFRMQDSFLLRWPIEDRYARFQWEIMRHLLELTGKETLPFVHFWPHGLRFALVLTHDIETLDGQSKVRRVADLEERLGFRSSFNFVLERYRLDRELIRELDARGFEIGVHGLRHDGKLFHSEAEFMRRAERINGHLGELGAVGFRAPLTQRNPEWMQALEIEYDLSFFDTDPYEPIPGGTMCIWPFLCGRFVEMPYTLVQDYTLTEILRERNARLWLEKVDFIKGYCGMALVNTHPDYLRNDRTWQVYVQYLQEMKRGSEYWHALPREVARWWRARASGARPEELAGAVLSEARLSGSALVIEPRVVDRAHAAK